jgi:hypothetical protein
MLKFIKNYGVYIAETVLLLMGFTLALYSLIAF